MLEKRFLEKKCATFVFCSLATRSVTRVIGQSVSLEQFNRGNAAYVSLTRNTELERLIIESRPVQNYPGRRPSLNVRPPVEQPNQPIIQHINQINRNPIQPNRPPTRRPSCSGTYTRPTVEDFLKKVNEVEHNNQAKEPTTMRRSTIFSRGRRPSTSVRGSN